MPANYTITTRSDGETLTAAKYNADHQNHIDHMTPAYIDDYSSNLSQMRSQVDPGEAGSESLPTSTSGELERLRYAIMEAKVAMDPTVTYWYETSYGYQVHNASAYGFNANASAATNVTALQAACGSTFDGTGPARIVMIPSGTFNINAVVEVPPNVSIVGVGSFSTNVTGSVLNLTHDGVGLRFIRRNGSPGNLFHKGGVFKIGFASSLGASSTTATRFIELGDPAAVNTSNGCWNVRIEECHFNNIRGYCIYSAHSQSAYIHYNFFRNSKFGILYNTVVADSKIINNFFIDEGAISGAIAIQMRPGTLGGAAQTNITGNYFLGFEFDVWLTSIIGANIRDNTFEGCYKTPIWCDKYLSDNVTLDESGCQGINIENNTFINWNASGSTTPKYPGVQLSWTSQTMVGHNCWRAPGGNAQAGIAIYDNGTATARENLIIWPFIHDNTPLLDANSVTIPPMPTNQVTNSQATIIAPQFYQFAGVSGDTLTASDAYPIGTWGSGENGRVWYDKTNLRLRIWQTNDANTLLQSNKIHFKRKVIAVVDSPYNASANDFVISVNTSGGAITVNLPASGIDGTVMLIHDITGNAGANNITIGSSEAINGVGSITLGTNFGATWVMRVSGPQWVTI